MSDAVSYCCKKARCVVSYIAEGYLEGVSPFDVIGTDPKCPYLYWDGDKYRCKLAKDPKFAKELAIGAGCCSPLNSERRKYVKLQEKMTKKL